MALLRISLKFVNDLIKLRRDTGSLGLRLRVGGGGHGKLAGVTGRIEARSPSTDWLQDWPTRMASMFIAAPSGGRCTASD
ncbi:MAG: hypothetical protein ACK5II_06985 [Paracoccus sp. (in: a-proteobacteria)]